MTAARKWTCTGCKATWPRTRQKCDCGRKRPTRRTASEKALVEPYEWWVERFGEVCGICGRSPKNRRLDRDHDHATGEPRGLLCFACNRGLPHWVTVQWLENAAAYLREAKGL